METQDRTLSVSSVVKRAYEVSKKHGLWVLLFSLMGNTALELGNIFAQTQSAMNLMQKSMLTGDWSHMLQIKDAEPSFSAGMLLTTLLVWLVGFCIYIFINMLINKILWQGVSETDTKIDLTQLIRSSMNKSSILFYLGVFILSGLAVCAGYLCCLLPGIYLTIRWLFVPIIAANFPEFTLSDCFTYSWNLTRHHFWQLLGLGLVAMFINIGGLCLCCVGMIFTSVLTSFMLAECFHRMMTEYEEQIAE